MNQEQGKCISIKDVPASFDESTIWLKKGSVVEYLRNKKNGYYFTSDGKEDHRVFLDDEFNEYFKLLDDFRNEKIDQIL
jgi:hypothetical protein